MLLYAQKQITIPKFPTEADEAEWWYSHPEVATEIYTGCLSSRLSTPTTVETSARLNARAIFDAVCAGVGLVLLSPLLILAGFAVVLDDGWPILFGQERVGRGGTPFRMWKFRSMRARVPGRSITSGDDPRVTRVGRTLRKYKIDELPQLWNVVRGQMSLVGPRPEIPRFVNINDPVWHIVLQGRPGITDLASLVYRNEEKILAMSSDPEAYYTEVILPAKLQLNLRYAQARSFWRDVRLILLTVRYSVFASQFDVGRILGSLSMDLADCSLVLTCINPNN